MRIENGMKTKGYLFWKRQWYSYCSRHRVHDEDCDICRVGDWTNVWLHSIGSLIFRLVPRIWIWWMNL